MSQPPDEHEPDGLLINKLMAKLAAFMVRYGSPPLVTARVTRAMTEIANLYQNARLRAHAAERRSGGSGKRAPSSRHYEPWLTKPGGCWRL